jgi:hypothetical protein
MKLTAILVENQDQAGAIAELELGTAGPTAYQAKPSNMFDLNIPKGTRRCIVLECDRPSL